MPRIRSYQPTSESSRVMTYAAHPLIPADGPPKPLTSHNGDRALALQSRTRARDLLNGTSVFDAGTCMWREARAEAEKLWLCKDFPKSDGYCTTSLATVRLQTCATAAGWTAFRMGPFVTRGGYDWNGYQFLLNSSHVPDCRRDDVHAMSDVIVGNTDVEDQLLGYPPIHQHHFHFSGSGDVSDPLLAVHGDQQCHESLGGAGCALRKSAPPGYAWFMRTPLIVNTEFNDVRAANSSALASYIFLAYKTRKCVAASPIRQIRLFVINLPFTDAQRGTYLVRTVGETVAWVNGSFAQAPAAWRQASINASLFENPLPTLLDGVFHSHSAMIDDIWLLQGTVEQVFADVTIAERAYRTLLHQPGAISALKANIEARAQLPNAARKVCRYRDLPEEVVGGAGFHPARHYKRRNRCIDLDPSVAEWVFVVFHRKTDDAPDGIPIGDFYHMHSSAYLSYSSSLDGAVALRPPSDPTYVLESLVAQRPNDTVARAQFEEQNRKTVDAFGEEATVESYIYVEPSLRNLAEKIQLWPAASQS